MFTKLPAYLIKCETGCRCCQRNNELRGPFRTEEIARLQATNYASWPLVASQYARNGIYQIIEVSAEELPDHRLILGNKLLTQGYIGENDVEDEPLAHGDSIHMLSGRTVATVKDPA